jgi:hypothetical protein
VDDHRWIRGAGVAVADQPFCDGQVRGLVRCTHTMYYRADRHFTCSFLTKGHAYCMKTLTTVPRVRLGLLQNKHV